MLFRSGEWKSGPVGQGRLSGQIGWAQGLAVELQLQGQRLPVTVEPYANLEVAPDLKIHMIGEKLAVTGKVLVPKGKITVRELPPSTVKVSDDTVIVGHQTEQSRRRWPWPWTSTWRWGRTSWHSAASA